MHRRRRGRGRGGRIGLSCEPGTMPLTITRHTLTGGLSGTEPVSRRTAARGAMGIQELAKSLGATQRALRYYEQVGLIRSDRNARGARTYGPQTHRDLSLIVTLRRTGHSIRDIRHILFDEDTGDDAVRHRIALTLRNRLSHLEHQAQEIRGLLDHCASADPSGARCGPLLQALAGRAVCGPPARGSALAVSVRRK